MFTEIFLEYNTKIYSDENYRLSAISSHFNALILLGFAREFQMNENWSLITRFNWTHYSNGSTKAPNLGLNIPTIGLGVHKKFKSKTNYKEVNVFPNPNWHFLFAGSIKQFKIEGPFYPLYILSVEKNISRKRRNYWSLGSDFIFDHSVKDQLASSLDSSARYFDNIKITAKASWNIPIGNLQISLQAGSYLKNSLFKKQFIFQRMALRYRFTENIGATISMRSHFAKADAIELGLIYTMP